MRFYREELWNRPTARVLAIHGNDVVEKHAYAVLAHPGENLPGFDGCGMALGQIMPRESYLRVLYVPDPDSGGVFVLTAMRLRGAVLRACRARQRTRGRHRFGERHRVQIVADGSATQPWHDPSEPPAVEQRFPPGWDEARVRRVIDHYQERRPEVQIAEDEAAARAARDPEAAEAEPGAAPDTAV
ncbi:MAG TPA: hypothetical protein VGE74_02825 [Gemmata sp.]